jgi:hypothetical protein
MFRPFSGWAIIRLRLEYQRKLIYYNVDIKHGELDLVLQCLGRSVAIYIYIYIYIYKHDVDSAMFTTLFVVSSVSTSTLGLESSLDVALGSDGRSVLCWVGLYIYIATHLPKHCNTRSRSPYLMSTL